MQNRQGERKRFNESSGGAKFSFDVMHDDDPCGFSSNPERIIDDRRQIKMFTLRTMMDGWVMINARIGIFTAKVKEMERPVCDHIFLYALIVYCRF